MVDGWRCPGADLILTAFDWVPETPRGYVLDLRVRWALEWLFAPLNSVEMASLPWSILAFSGDIGDTPGWKRLDEFLKARLQHLEPVLGGREWLAGSFSVADILMADVLRLVDRFDGLAEHPACRHYVARATARPSFVKAHADQIAHFAAADSTPVSAFAAARLKADRRETTIREVHPTGRNDGSGP